LLIYQVHKHSVWQIPGYVRPGRARVRRLKNSSITCGKDGVGLIRAKRDRLMWRIRKLTAIRVVPGGSGVAGPEDMPMPRSSHGQKHYFFVGRMRLDTGDDHPGKYGTGKIPRPCLPGIRRAEEPALLCAGVNIIG